MSVLARFAAVPAHSRGRRHPEPPPAGRSEFERDRDRIIHSTAFRRLEYKTQVFVNHEGDLFRTRLTHSIEVAQIGRTIARNLGLNEVLVEAVALAHDLGHTPFGHAGQDELNACMAAHGGFEHNLQSLRVVDLLEERYADFDGLNLCFETREGILKHCSVQNAQSLGDVGERFLGDARPSMEAQVANLADEIAYNNHDVDDGLRSGLISIDELEHVSLFSRHLVMARRECPSASGRRLIHEIVRRMINTLVLDLIGQTTANISKLEPDSIDQVRRLPTLVAFSAELAAEQRELKQFLRQRLYRHYQVERMSQKARRIVRELFGAFRDNPKLLPPQYQTKAQDDKMRTIADYIAGMTDRYAYREYRRLFSIEEM